MCGSEPRGEVKHLEAQQELTQSAEHSESTLQEYTTPYYMSKGNQTEQNTIPKSTVKNLKTIALVQQLSTNYNEYIWPLWICQSRSSNISRTVCEVDTGAGCNVLPFHKAKELFGQE